MLLFWIGKCAVQLGQPQLTFFSLFFLSLSHLFIYFYISVKLAITKSISDLDDD